MASTSLSEQLKRLQRPQTSQLVTQKKRPSILFDAKEAAEKDRETIFEIGLSGLQELIQINTAFEQFEQTLFNRSSKDLVRSIETTEVNKHLTGEIRRFMHYLSPVFMLQPAHKCLEWLIRRFSVESYDQDDFAMLILPYHGTRIFVRCVQILEVTNTRWEWLETVKKSGAPLAKQTLFNRLAADQALIQAVTNGTIAMAKTLAEKAYTLQTAFAFYCTSILGCLEYVGQVTEAHFANILPGILKGLSSPAVDFTSAALIILGDLLGRISLSAETLDTLVVKLMNIIHPGMEQEVLMLLIFLFQSQGDHYKAFPTTVIDQLLGQYKAFLTTLSELSAAHYRVSPIFVPILTVVLRRVQENGDDFDRLKNFCEQAFAIVVFSESDAQEVIKCVLTSYALKETAQADEDVVIMIDSEDESDIPMSDTNEEVALWYSGYVRLIERQYPDLLSRTMKEILAVDNRVVSEHRKRSLKAVLGFLLTTSLMDDGNVDLFEGLFHHRAKDRVHAVRSMVSKFDQILEGGERARDLVKSTLEERLFDSDPRVVSEILKLPTETLVEHVTEETFLKRAFEVLNTTVPEASKGWPQAKLELLSHVLGYKKWTLVNATELFIQLFPLLIPRQENELALFEKLLDSQEMAKKWPVLKVIKQKASQKSPEKIQEVVLGVLKGNNEVVPLRDLIGFCEKSGVFKYPATIYYSLKLMRLNKEKTDIPTAVKVLQIFQGFVKTKQVQTKNEEFTKQSIPSSFISEFMQSFIGSVAVSKKFLGVNFQDKNQESEDVLLLRNLFEQIIRFLFESKLAGDEKFPLLLKNFFLKFFEDEKDVSDFLANYFSVHKLYSAEVNQETQLMAVAVAKALMQKNSEQINVSDSGMLKIFGGVTSPVPFIRENVYACLESLSERGPEQWRKLTLAILKNKTSLEMDQEQISFIVFNFLTANQKTKSMSPVTQQFIDVIVDDKTPAYISALGLQMIQHVNSSAMVTSLSAMVASLFDRVSATGQLNRYEMEIVEEIVNRLNQSTMVVTAKNTAIWDNLILKILKNAHVWYKSETETNSPFLKLLQVMDEEMFAKLNHQLQIEFVKNSIQNCCDTTRNQPLFSHAVAKLIKTLPLHGQIVQNVLEEMTVNPNVPAKTGPRARRIDASADLLLTDNWRRGVVLLEMIQNKKDLSNLQSIVPALFKILKTCVDFDEQNPVDYVNQLVLSSLLLCCQQLEEKIVKIDGGLKVDLVVNCIRGSVNPQTHHHALQLICQLAPLAPELVLQNITDIFTFMGSTIVRQDDAYSFQIILKIIDSVVPILIQKSQTDSVRLVAVLKTFADIILDVPEHRRQSMYVKLLTTLDKQFLWVFVAIVLSNHVLQEKATKGEKEDDLPKAIRIALSILSEFEPVVVVETTCHLLDFMQKIRLEEELVLDQGKKIKSGSSFEEGLELAIFDVQKTSKKQQRHMKYMLIKFISNAMAAPAFVRSVNGRQQDDDEFKRIKPFYQEFIIKDLMCIASTAQIQSTGQYWKVILHHCYESLNNVILLLTNQMFFAVVEGLLKHTIWTVRKKMLELLVNRFQDMADDQALSEEDQVSLIKLLVPLEQIILTIKDRSQAKRIEDGEAKSANEMLIIQQLALIVVKLMGKLVAESYPEEMTNVLRILIDLLEHRNEIPVVVLSANVLCIADLSVNVGASAIEFLPVFMPIFLEILNTQTYNATVDTILASMLTALQKIVETFAIFLSAFLVDILVALSRLSVKLEAIPQKDQKVNSTLARITEMEAKIATYNPLRILVPAVESAYTKLIVDPKAVEAIGPLMSVLAKSISEVAPQDVYGVQEELTNFFLEALQFRATYAEGKNRSLSELNAIEDRIVETLISLTLKLSETTFKPLYCKVYDWAIRDSEDEDTSERTITFYRLTSKIAEALKSLFVLFSMDFTNNSANLLNRCHLGKQKDEAENLFFANDQEKCATLIEGIMNSYLNIFTYDANKYMDQTRFETLCNVMVDQLENEIVLDNVELTDTVSKAVSQMGLSIDDSLWRQLNYAILMKTKHHDHRVRLLSLRTVVDFARIIGEEYQSMLPETIPFISELMEDENSEVEKGCQKYIQELEGIVKDSLQKYL